jgi:hypothetical protein
VSRDDSEIFSGVGPGNGSSARGRASDPVRVLFPGSGNGEHSRASLYHYRIVDRDPAPGPSECRRDTPCRRSHAAESSRAVSFRSRECSSIPARSCRHALRSRKSKSNPARTAAVQYPIRVPLNESCSETSWRSGVQRADRRPHDPSSRDRPARATTTVRVSGRHPCRAVTVARPRRSLTRAIRRRRTSAGGVGRVRCRPPGSGDFPHGFRAARLPSSCRSVGRDC